MAWDFSTEPEFQKKLDWVEDFCRNEIEPLDLVFPYAVRSKDERIRALVKPLQDEIKAQGLWAIFLDEELGGPGYGQLKLGLLNEILGKYPSAPQMFGAAAPDTGTWRCSPPTARGAEGALAEADARPAAVVGVLDDEPQGGSDPNLFKTSAFRDGDEWVINGEKWFTSAGRVADLLFVMCTNGMYVVPRTTPGVEIQPSPATTTTSSTGTCGPPRPPARPGGRRQGAGPAPPRRWPHPPRDADDRPVHAGVRHDVRAGA
jgi:alkylation response protein AidB-like acyl-CoA dehydrogenase